MPCKTYVLPQVGKPLLSTGTLATVGWQATALQLPFWLQQYATSAVELRALGNSVYSDNFMDLEFVQTHNIATQPKSIPDLVKFIDGSSPPLAWLLTQH